MIREILIQTMRNVYLKWYTSHKKKKDHLELNLSMMFPHFVSFLLLLSSLMFISLLILYYSFIWVLETTHKFIQLINNFLETICAREQHNSTLNELIYEHIMILRKKFNYALEKLLKKIILFLLILIFISRIFH